MPLHVPFAGIEPVLAAFQCASVAPELFHFMVSARHDQLSQLLVGDATQLAVLIQLGPAISAQLSLEASRLIVQSCNTAKFTSKPGNVGHGSTSLCLSSPDTRLTQMSVVQGAGIVRDVPECMIQELRPLVCVPKVSPCS